jgi:aerobic carbon-monoxide dehydrogenase medium subunit
MNYVAPATLAEAYDALQDDEAACLAGGQSLVAMMNLGLATPASLVSLRRIDALRGIEYQPDGGLRIGAMVTHAELAALQASAPGPALLAKAARVVAYPAVRTRGTIGGSVALADPSADYPAALMAAGATVELGAATGTRRVAARDFFLGLFETARLPGEIVLAIHLPAGPAGGGSAYEKLTLVAGDFAIVSVAAVAGAEAGAGAADDLVTVDVAVGGCGSVPIRLSGIEPDDGALLAAGRDLARTCRPSDDHRASAAYRRRVLPELVRRAGRAALAEVSA